MIKEMNEMSENTNIEKHEIRTINTEESDIPNYKVELTTYKDAGAIIEVWEDGASKLEHIWKNNEDKTMHQITEAHFWHQENAMEEWEYLTDFENMVDLMQRNS